MMDEGQENVISLIKMDEIDRLVLFRHLTTVN